MKDIIEYKILVAKGIEKLQEAVNKAIKDGWQPYGDLRTPRSIWWTRFTQVLVKFKQVEGHSVPASARKAET
jgi:hypothetical protein